MRRAATLGPVALLAALCSIALADGLSSQQEAQLKQQLAEAVSKSEWPRAAQLMTELAPANDKKTWDLLVKVAERAPEGSDCASALRAAAQVMDDRKVQDAVKKTATKSRSVYVRRELALHVGAQQDWPTCIELLNDADEEVAARAAHRLINGKVEAAIDPMIAAMERLDRTHDGIWDILRNGLGKLLGQRLESGIEYRSRWEVVKQQGGLQSVQPKEEAVEVQPLPPGGVSSSVRLFGRAIECTRIVFILDVSGSMTAIDPNAQDAPDVGTVTRGGGESQGPAQPKGLTRLDRAKRELKSVLMNLPAATKVNIVTYSSPTDIQTWRGADGEKPPTVHAMSEANKKSACEFIEGETARGTTATDLALVRAFDVEGARCFYLLSDGAATHDGTTPVPLDAILGVIDDVGKDRNVTIHTLGFQGADREAMMAIARHTGGKYSDIR